MTDNHTPLPDDTWDPDTRRVLTRIDDSHDEMTQHDYLRMLADALATPAEG